MIKAATRGEEVDVVFVDPLRSGCSLDFLNSLIRLDLDRIVYISCNMETLARDLEYLKKFGFISRRGALVDLFPWTYHLECVVLISKIKRLGWITACLDRRDRY